MFLLKLFLILFLGIQLFAQNNKTCIYINSYHKGYSWSDKILNTIHHNLKNSCDIIDFFMDSKRNKNRDFIEKKALEAKKLIETINPDIVLFSDDNAAKFLVKPYFKDSKIPFLFCGINWSAKEYGFPTKNIKGIIEVLPIKSIYKLATQLSSGKYGIFIGDDTITDKKDLFYFKKIAKKENIKLDSKHVSSLDDWKKAYKEAQDKYDFIILGHNSAIKGWEDKSVKEFISKNSKILSFSTYSWMLPYSMIGQIIKAQEHGEWVSHSAKAILNGYDIKNMNITINKTWNSYINYDLIKYTKINFPREIKNKFKKYEEELN